MKKGKPIKVRLGVIFDVEIKGLVEVLELLPEDWEVMVVPNSKFGDLVDFKPNVILYRGSLDNPFFDYLRQIEVPKIILLPLGFSEMWNTISLEKDWDLLGDDDKRKSAERIKDTISEILA